MDFLTMAQERYSVRSYSQAPVEEEKIEKILKAAQYAPTALNFQPQKIYMVKSPEAMEKLRFVCRYVKDAPMAALICYDMTKSWKHAPDKLDAGEMDCAITAPHMMLEAGEQGVGTCFIRGYNNRDIIGMFNLPEHIKPVCILAMGYPSEKSHPYAKMHGVYRELDEMVEEL